MAIGDVAVSQPQGPQYDPEFGILSVWSLTSSCCVCESFLQVPPQFPPTSQSMSLGTLKKRQNFP